jgi:hypothetical protein
MINDNSNTNVVRVFHETYGSYKNNTSNYDSINYNSNICSFEFTFDENILIKFKNDQTYLFNIKQIQLEKIFDENNKIINKINEDIYLLNRSLISTLKLKSVTTTFVYYNKYNVHPQLFNDNIKIKKLLLNKKKYELQQKYITQIYNNNIKSYNQLLSCFNNTI